MAPITVIFNPWYTDRSGPPQTSYVLRFFLMSPELPRNASRVVDASVLDDRRGGRVTGAAVGYPSLSSETCGSGLLPAVSSYQPGGDSSAPYHKPKKARRDAFFRSNFPGIFWHSCMCVRPVGSPVSPEPGRFWEFRSCGLGEYGRDHLTPPSCRRRCWGALSGLRILLTQGPRRRRRCQSRKRWGTRPVCGSRDHTWAGLQELRE